MNKSVRKAYSNFKDKIKRKIAQRVFDDLPFYQHPTFLTKCVIGLSILCLFLIFLLFFLHFKSKKKKKEKERECLNY